jgi:hypothetical protein
MKKYISRAVDFKDYFSLQEEFAKLGKTSGENQSEELVEYTKLNYKRMKKWHKIYKPSEEIIDVVNKIDKKETWLVLAESWCGDAAQNLSQLNKIAEINSNIDLKILHRDENLELMDQFLTNGGRSIPKLIRLENDSEEVINTWGPRPAKAQEIVMKNKKENLPYAEELHTWYTKDKNKELELEFMDLLRMN